MENTQNSRIKLMAHLVVGYPSLEKTVVLAKAMVEAGADVLELQIPFSDPLADGPTIMRACEESLQNGTRLVDAFDVMRALTLVVSVPLYFMCYYNTIFHVGVEEFCRRAKEAGSRGLIVPDMPLDEERYEHLFSTIVKYGLDNIRVVSPASTDERLQQNAQTASGFVYATAVQGITGVRSALNKDLSRFLPRVKKYFNIPVAVGFGISKIEHVQFLRGYADIAVVGSAIIEVINRSDEKTMIGNVSNFILSLRHSGK